MTFSKSDIGIWQVPRNACCQMLAGNAELHDLATASRLGRYLKSELDGMATKLAAIPGFPPLALS